jgi:hypothetical protein
MWRQHLQPIPTPAQLIQIITKDDSQSQPQLYPSVFPAKYKIVIASGICCQQAQHSSFHPKMYSTCFTKKNQMLKFHLKSTVIHISTFFFGDFKLGTIKSVKTVAQSEFPYVTWEWSFRPRETTNDRAEPLPLQKWMYNYVSSQSILFICASTSTNNGVSIISQRNN